MQPLTRLVFLWIICLCSISISLCTIKLHHHTAPPTASVPAPPAQFEKQLSNAEAAPILVAEVFGRAPGCRDADPVLVQEVANAALHAGIDPKILAATVAQESACNPYAVSSKGAIGLCQIVPKVWAKQYDFVHKYNLLNPLDNLAVGSDILAHYIHDHGAVSGLRHYNGLGEDCTTCDAAYVAKVEKLAHQ